MHGLRIAPIVKLGGNLAEEFWLSVFGRAQSVSISAKLTGM